jgi:outer membrane protein assembly factor BamB
MCTDALTGALQWQYDLVKQFNAVVPPWYAGQCPYIDGNHVIIATGGSALLVAFDLASGKVVWQTPNPLGWQMTHSSIVPIYFQGQRSYIYCADQGVVGVSAKNGALLWQTTEWRVSTATIPSPIPVGDGKIFITGGYNSGSIMLQLMSQNGRIGVQTLFRLKPNMCSSDQQTPICYKGNIYAVISGGMLACLDLSGRQLWSSGSSHRFGMGPFMIAAGMIYLLDDTGTLTLAAASPAGYQQYAQAKVLDGHDAWGPMALAGGRLIVRDLTKMVCLDVAKH